MSSKKTAYFHKQAVEIQILEKIKKNFIMKYENPKKHFF